MRAREARLPGAAQKKGRPVAGPPLSSLDCVRPQKAIRRVPTMVRGAPIWANGRL